MATSMFINLPIKDLEKSKAFFEALGWTINKQFTDETAASVVISDTIYAMLLTHDKYRQFTDKKIVDASASSEVLIAISQDSKEAVHKLVDAAVKAGAKDSDKDGIPDDEDACRDVGTTVPSDTQAAYVIGLGLRDALLHADRVLEADELVAAQLRRADQSAEHDAGNAQSTIDAHCFRQAAPPHL